MKRFLPLIFVLLCSVVYAQDTTSTARKVAVGVSNSSSTGTTKNRLAKLSGAPSRALVAATTDSEGIIGIVTSGAGTTGIATIQTSGQALCDFDGATTSGHYVAISTTTAGKCHDAGLSYPDGQVIGRVLSTNSGAGTYDILLTASGVKTSTGVIPNAPITGATKTKITYDSKGLVTSGTDIGASDLPSGIDAAKLGNGSVSNTEYQRLDGVTSAIQTQLDGKQASLGYTAENSANKDQVSGYAGLTSGALLKTAEFPAFTGDVTTVAGGVATTLANTGVVAGTCSNCELTVDAKGRVTSKNSGSSGITNIATVNNVPRTVTDGNLDSSTITDDGTNSSIGAVAHSVVSIGQAATSVYDSDAGTITHNAPVGFSVASPLFGAGDDGQKFQINDLGRIVKYQGAAPNNGELFIGNAGGGRWQTGTLTPGTGIDIINGVGSITISTTGASPTASYLAADYTNATASFTNIALSVTLGAGKKYSFVCQVFVSDSVAADGFSIDFNGGAATATNFIAGTSTSLVTGVTTSLTGTYSNGTVTGTNLLTISGSIEVNAGGTFIVRAKQSSHTAGTLTVSRGSAIVFTEIL